MHPLRLSIAAGLALVAAATAAPALAQDLPPPPAAQSPDPLDRFAWAPGQREAYERAREGWLYECRRRMALSLHRDDGVGGALIGGVLGGLAGNRIAGRGDRTFGTVAGAAVGAIAGAAIDRAEDRTRSEPSDYCESYLDYHTYAATYQQAGYMPPVMMVPVAPKAHGAHYAAPAKPECTEEVVYEDIDVPVDRPARRVIPRRPAPKRVPDKRIPL